MLKRSLSLLLQIFAEYLASQPVLPTEEESGQVGQKDEGEEPGGGDDMVIDLLS